MAKKYPKIKRYKIHYKKPKRNFSVLKTLLFIVLIAALIFLAYSVAGPIKKLLTGELTSSSGASSSSSQITSQATVSSPSDTTSSVSSAPPVIETTVKAVALPREALLDSTKLAAFIEQAKASGYTAVVAPLKDQDGLIYYQSAVCEAKAMIENAVNAEELAKKIEDAGLIPIASVHTFEDRTATDKKKDNTFLLKGSTNTYWYNKSASQGGKPWLNPYKEAARSYNTAIVEELAKAGFREIILKSVQFPDVYSMSKAALPETPSFSDILNQYISEAKAAANKYQAKISVSYPSVGYWKAQPVAFGGEAGGLDADRISPVIRLADYGNKLTIGESVLDDPVNNADAALKMILNEIRVKTSSKRPEIVPILSASEVNEALIQALTDAGITDYIVE